MPDLSGRPTQTESTVRAYLKRYDDLKRRAAREHGLVEPGPLEIAEYAKSIAGELAAATWRQYRAALRFGFEAELPSQEHVKAVTSLDAFRREPESRPTELRTSAQKKKTTNADEIDVLFSAIARSAARRAESLLALLKATAIVGCRPCEWWGSALKIDDEVTVSIRNAKTTNGRGAGEQRNLAWQTLPDAVLRHRFSALAKSEFAAEIVAACMGHGSDATAARNYARAGSKNVKMAFETEAGLPTPEAGPVRATKEKRLQSLTRRRTTPAKSDRRILGAETPSAHVEAFEIKLAVSSVGADIDAFPVPNKLLNSSSNSAAEKFHADYLAEQARVWDELLAPYTCKKVQPALARRPAHDDDAFPPPPGS